MSVFSFGKLSLLLAIVFAVSVQSNSVTADHDEIIALVPKYWPPQYQTDNDGNAFGFAIDVMDEIASMGHFRVSYKTYPNFSVVVDALVAGEGDLIPNSGILEDRLDRFTFTSPVETFQVRVIVRDEEQIIEGFDDLAGKTVAVVKKNVGLFLLKEREDLTLRIENDLQDALFSLISGNADALVYPGSVALSMARNARIDDRIKAVGAPVKEVKRGIRFLIESQKLRDQLEPLVVDFVKSEAYARIYQKWYGKPRPLLTNNQIYVLFGVLLASVSATFLGWRHYSLKSLNRSLTEQNRHQLAALKSGIQEKETLVHEVHHRVKNNLQVILSMLSLQKRSLGDGMEARAIVDSARRVRVMAKLYEHLYQSDNVSSINPSEYFSDVLRDSLNASAASDNVQASLNCTVRSIDIKTATTLAQIISELVSNSIKHAFPDGSGEIHIGFSYIGPSLLELRVADNGVGLPENFDEAELKSMGMKLVNALVSQLDATKSISSENGTSVVITFPEKKDV